MPRFRLLGPIEVLDGQEWRGIGAPKWRAVLAMLLLSPGQVVSADALCDALWGDDQPASARSLLSLYVMRLRRLLNDDGDLLASRTPGYILRLRELDTDVQLFQKLILDTRQLLDRGDPEAAAARTREALALWRGQPLADVRLALGTGLEHEIERLTELRVHAVELRILAELGCGRLQPSDGVAELSSLLDANPLRENLWHLLMRVLENAGRRAEAIDTYGRARTAIAEELGVDPGPELRSFYERLLAEDSANAGQAGRRAVAALLNTPRGTVADHTGVNIITSTTADDISPLNPPVTAAHPGSGTGDQVPGRAARRSPDLTPARGETPGGEDFGRALSTAINRAGMTASQVAGMTGLISETAAWCADGSGLPPLTSEGLSALRAILATCGITSPDQVLAWTDALIQAHEHPGHGSSAAAPVTAGTAAPVPDAPGYDLCPDPLQARTPAEFVQALAAFRVWAGRPPLRAIEEACGHEISIATISTVLRSPTLPPLRTALAIVRGCGGTPDHQERFATAWRQLQAPAGRKGLYPVRDTA